jgi:8-oxo-dGTP pyrophosphatase MutT (NUDIX family)
MITRYGQPEEASFEIPVPEEEFRFIRSTQRNGRRHDVTVYAFKADEVIVIAKHFYPPGMYRAPSGGIAPGESFEEGTAREMMEETGTQIMLERFLLQSHVTFTSPLGDIPWVSFVFQAQYLAGDFRFTDTREIREVRTARLEEFIEFGKIMRTLDKGGLHYRAALHETVAPLLR